MKDNLKMLSLAFDFFYDQNDNNCLDTKHKSQTRERNKDFFFLSSAVSFVKVFTFDQMKVFDREVKS